MPQRFESWEDQVRRAKAKAAQASNQPPESIDGPALPPPLPNVDSGKSSWPWLAIGLSTVLASVATFVAMKAVQGPAAPKTVVTNPGLPISPESLADLIDSAVAERTRDRQRAELKEARMIGHLKGLAISAIEATGVDLIQPLWLKKTITVEWKSTRWVVEGIVLERPDSPTAYFWGVEIQPVDESGPETWPPDMKILHVTFNLAVWKANGDGTYTRLKDRTVKQDEYRKLNYD